MRALLSLAILIGTVFAAGTATFSHAEAPAAVSSAAAPATVGSLSGTYVFLLRGFVGGNNATTAGTFVADGQGNITSGVLDSNTGQGAVGTFSFTGSYTGLGVNQVSLTLNLPIGSVTLPLYLGGFNTGPVATELRTAVGAGGGSAAGVFYLQDPAIASQTAFNPGSFAFGLSGGVANNRLTAVGRFDASAGGAIANGELDAFSLLSGGAVNALNAQPFSGTWSTTLVGGRGTAVFIENGAALHFSVYPVSNDQLLMMETDSAASGLPSDNGMALRQIASTSAPAGGYGFTVGSLNGTDVFSLGGLSGPSGIFSEVGLFGFNGSGVSTVTAVQQTNGQSNTSAQGTVPYSVDDNGRLSISGVPGSPALVGYITASGHAFLASPDNSLSFGFSEPQTATAITTGTLSAGQYLFGSTSPQAASSPIDAGLVTFDGNGNLTAYAASVGGSGAFGASGLATYAIDSTGLLTSSVGMSGYVVSANQLLAVGPFSNYGVPLVFDQVNAGSPGTGPGGSPLINTALGLSASTSSALSGASVTLTATVNPAAATGTITFYDGTAVLGTAPLNAGIAMLATAALPTGLQTITARYGGDSSYAGSSSTSVQVTIVAPGLSQVSGTANPQVAAYIVTLPQPGSVTIDFGKDTGYGLETSTQEVPAGIPTTIYVAGMLTNTTYHMRAAIAYDDGLTATDADHTFTTGSIQAGLIPIFTVATTNGLTPQPGVELTDILQGVTPSIPFASDLSGNVIWTYLFPDRQAGSIVYPIKLLPNGHFFCLIAPANQIPLQTGPVPASTLDVLREIDLAGNTIRQVSMAQLNSSLAQAGYNIQLQLFSHDFQVLPNGHVLVIANMLKPYTNLVGYPGTTQVLGDVVVDLDQNFKPVWVWNEFDHLDVNRHPMNFPDWTHSNAIAYSPDDGNFLISLRHQNWIIKVDYQNGAGAGDIIWKLGYQGDFTLQGATDPTDWFYAQHDVNFVSTNTTGNFQIAVMDNGDDRVFPAGVTCNSPGAPACLYSSAQVLQIDENAKTASFVFHDIEPPTLYNAFAGNTRVEPNGDVEFDLAGVGSSSFIYEVTPTSTPQVVWSMQVVNDNTYRAFRMPSLYPGVQW